MLHRSFKPAKCKTSLKLATSRLKLMKNKKGVQLNQMKKELAQLLESGKDQTARIRVEHVIREEKMITAYELIEIYCELIAARLPIIESQKNCPIDLKEAIASVIFASPRCADIPELLEIRKHFTAKYGKEFISRAIELRPDCGVSRMLVEKLSAVSPDGQTKMKVLNAIADEHNIKWEPKSFGEKDSMATDDLLNGPNTSEKASMMPVESPNFQTPSVQVPPIRDQKHDGPLKFSEQNIKSLCSQKFSSADAGGTNTEISSTSHPDVTPSGMGSEGMDMTQSFRGDGNAFLSSRKNWHMDFKDAISAAQEAAESAEQASIAARAAAELSNIHGLQDERHGKHSSSNLRGEHPANDSASNSFQDENLKLKKEQLEGNTERSSQSASSTSSETSTDDDTLVNSIRNVEICSKTSSFEEEDLKPENPFSSGISMKRRSRESIDFKSENLDYFEEENTFSGDCSYSNSNHLKFGNDVAEDPFVGIGQGSIHRETKKMNSYEDCSSSDSGVNRFNMGPKYDEGESPPYFSSLGRESLTHFPPLSTFRGGYSVSNEKLPSQAHFSAEWHSPLEFSESSVKWVDHSQSDNYVPVTFDYSDGPKFDSDDELEKSGPSGTKDSNILPYEQDVFTLNPEPADCHCSHGLTGSLFSKKGNSGSDGSPWLQTCSDDSDFMEVGRMKNQWTKASPSSSETASSSGGKISSKASLMEQQQNTIALTSYENPKTSSLSEQTSSGENSRKNASHVHPKLPDYDVVAAHLQSLRKHA